MRFKVFFFSLFLFGHVKVKGHASKGQTCMSEILSHRY